MTETPEHKPEYEGWAILELMGHRKIAGRVSEVTVAGTQLIRVDVPGAEETVVTQYYGGSAIYCMTPCDEAAARETLNYGYGLPEPVVLALSKPEPDVDAEDAEFDDDISLPV